ncbi:MAG: type 4a pilus biogenesis protein PilO [Candidatus Zixiibacteriota bacterium]
MITGLLLTCVWFFLFFVPYHKEKKQLKDNIAKSEKQLQDYQQTIKNLPSFLKRKKELELIKSNLNSKLYTKNDVLKLFKNLSSEAENNKLKVTEITPPIEELLYLNSIIPDSTQPQFLNIGLQLEGDYINFGKFVEIIEKADYFRGINSCQISKIRQENEKTSFYLGFKALLGRSKG